MVVEYIYIDRVQIIEGEVVLGYANGDLFYDETWWSFVNDYKIDGCLDDCDTRAIIKKIEIEW